MTEENLSKGSYRNYYKRNEYGMDRLNYLKREWFENKVVLDIGCNDGSLTCHVAKSFHPSKIIGIDIDHVLIDAAKSVLKRAEYDLQHSKSSLITTPISSSPPPSTSTSTTITTTSSQPSISATSLDKSFSSSPFLVPRTLALKSSIIKSKIANKDIQKSQTIKPTTNTHYIVYPKNILFYHMNIYDYYNIIQSTLISTPLTTTTTSTTTSNITTGIHSSQYSFTYDSSTTAKIHIEDVLHIPTNYDTILCLSITKWIHLNYGDTGLLNFFHILYELCHIDGYLILEYQPWKSYQNKKKLNTHINTTFNTIEIRPEQFESILVEKIGFSIVERYGPSVQEAHGYHRPILILQKTRKQQLTSLSLSRASETLYGMTSITTDTDKKLYDNINRNTPITMVNNRHIKSKDYTSNTEENENNDSISNSGNVINVITSTIHSTDHNRKNNYTHINDKSSSISSGSSNSSSISHYNGYGDNNNRTDGYKSDNDIISSKNDNKKFKRNHILLDDNSPYKEYTYKNNAIITTSSMTRTHGIRLQLIPSTSSSSLNKGTSISNNNSTSNHKTELSLHNNDSMPNNPKDSSTFISNKSSLCNYENTRRLTGNIQKHNHKHKILNSVQLKKDDISSKFHIHFNDDDNNNTTD